ncbi:uncharacterized protein LOC128227538 [Mya arenaria]|nr:uncharacterized protein LOC128227538 [Mya arenaria]XP_052794143.1 uncharacterized protein LOC128227538 [Mya arenaria]XP_052794144.1 uncharacterized protein LOC128227538 [Mya arenaria]
MAPRFAVILRTNLNSVKNTNDFLKATSQFLSQRFNTEEKNLTLEVHTDVAIMRGGTTDPAFNIDVHHNTDAVTKATKVDIAEDIAAFINKQLDVNIDKTLVLFFDTRKCT